MDKESRKIPPRFYRKSFTREMATYDDLSLHVRLFMKSYPFSRYRVDKTSCSRLARPLSESRLALVTTAGLRTPDQDEFDHSDKRGDPSFREIPNTIETRLLVESHRSYSFDHEGIRSDANLAFPLDRFRELEERGVIGELNHRHFSFMGSIVGPRRLIDGTAPQVARMLAEDRVDAVFLTPV
ncbi:MAG TPA: glycine/sarcosine/betaine reductase selenoprotein B family protein [Blastocatellia bacterium]|nr:glycine/sarcosine/betaine reductase selenoprotein B family protein [Blastocatellia bacterium]